MTRKTTPRGSIIVSVIVSIIYLSMGVLFLAWGTWAALSGQGSRPAGLEYFVMIFGAVLTSVGIFVVLRQVRLSRQRMSEAD